MAMADDQPISPQGVTGPDEKVSVSWLILQRLDDLKAQMDDLKGQMVTTQQDLHKDIQAVKHEEIQIVEHDSPVCSDSKRHLDSLQPPTSGRFEDTLRRQRVWSIVLIVVLGLGLLTKLLFPGA